MIQESINQSMKIIVKNRSGVKLLSDGILVKDSVCSYTMVYEIKENIGYDIVVLGAGHRKGTQRTLSPAQTKVVSLETAMDHPSDRRGVHKANCIE